MKKSYLLLVLFSVSVLDASAQATWNNTSFVHRSNQQILDGQGNSIKLDGVNLGGWLMWEGWLWGGGYTQQKTIYNKIESVVGTASAEAFRDSIYKNFITRKDIQRISEECYNSVRIPFNSSLLEDDFTPYTYKPEGWEVLDSVLKWCEDYNVYAILDMHSAPGGQSGSFTSDPDLFINLWNGAVNKTRTRRMWKAIADRYKDRGIIAAYDLLNEPDVASDSTMLSVYNEIIDSVRSVDNNHMLFIEGNNYAADFSMFTGLPDANSAFQFHFYTWFFGGSIPAHLAGYTTLSDNLNAPFWCGEWGENNYGTLGTTLGLFNDPSYRICGNSFWTWKKTKEGSNYPYYAGVDTTTDWYNTIKWAGNASLPQPTAAQMQNGMNEFIQNIKLANCSFNDTMSGVLNACVPAGIENESPQMDYAVFPNPFTDKISITGTGVAGSATVAVYNISGQRIKTAVIGGNACTINLSELDAGMYFVQIVSGNKILLSTKVVKAVAR